ncbi:MAG: hypothetical protein ACREMH_09425 [Gemmatimonadales bacterium]
MKPGRWEILAAAIAFVALAVQLSVPLNWDVAWLTYLAREANAGVRVYREYIEINPPLQLWLLRPVVAVADLVGVPVTSMVKWTLFGVAMGLTWIVGSGLPSRLRGQLLCGTALGALLLPMDQFGQRDHYSALLLLPGATIAGLRRTGNAVEGGRAAFAGLLAGVALALKPHYAVVLPLLAAYGAWGKPRWWQQLVGQPELWVPPIVFAVYLVGIAVATPEYFGQARTYGAYYMEWHRAQIHEWLQPLTFMTLAACLGWGAVRRESPHKAFGDALLLTLLGLYAAALIQYKGFSYHLLPAAIGGSVLLPLIVSGRRHLVTLLVGLVLGIALYQGRRWSQSAAIRVDAVSATLHSTGAKSVLVATHMVRTAWPAVLMEEIRWSSSFPSTWWMARLVEKQVGGARAEATLDGHALAPVERRLLGRFADDLERRRPDLLITYVPDRRIDPYRVGIMEVLALEPRARKAVSQYAWRRGGNPSLCLYVRRDFVAGPQQTSDRAEFPVSRCEPVERQAHSEIGEPIGAGRLTPP